MTVASLAQWHPLPPPTQEECIENVTNCRQDSHALAHSHPTVAQRGRAPVFVGVVLALMLWIGPSWGGPPNPTPSAGQGNTAGGSDALLNTIGNFNTAFGRSA